MQDILFFSNNSKKIEEIYNFFKKSSVKLTSLNDYNKIKSPEETGTSFEENAKIKSLYGYKHFNKICFADDSGICIKALDNNPGIKSKEFLYSKNKPLKVLEKIISITKNKNTYEAFFQTTICLTINKNTHMYFTGKIEGEISNKIKGSNGFGYDPIFIPNGHKLTFGEMPLNKKNIYSHRGIAIQKLKKYLFD